MGKVLKTVISVLVVGVLLLVSSCASQKKLHSLKKNIGPSIQLALGNQQDFLPEVENKKEVIRDTLKVKDEDGKEFFVVKAVKDEETGDMIATEELDAAMVTARFRNVAERDGKVDLSFQIIVPPTMQDSKWQLRFYPDMFVLGDSVRLDPVIITGEQYRKVQLRGYQQYDRFLAKIVQDSTKLINIRLLEVFLERNIPELFQFKTDSSFVSDEVFYSYYGVNERQAVEHYTNRFLTDLNEKRKAKRERMYRRFIKSPIVTEKIKLDSVVVKPEGDFLYNYVQTINTQPKLRKADIILSGEIYEQEKKLYSISPTQPLTFYISSISSFVDSTERYLLKIVERRAMANTESRIDFAVGKSAVVPEYGNNMAEIELTKKTLASLIENSVFDVDSVIVSAAASPDGAYAINEALSQKRSEAVSAYFENFIREYTDSLIEDRGIVASLGTEDFVPSDPGFAKVTLTPRCIPENWEDLHSLVKEDMVMNSDQKNQFFKLYDKYQNRDVLEAELRKYAFYNYMKSTLYPKLRTVKFNFYLHRKGMVKDTIHTTVIDENYRAGVAALKDMDYELAYSLLSDYKDYNTALACMGLEKNATAMKILKQLPQTDKVNYLMAILHSRSGDFEKAVEKYLIACKQNPSLVFRGNLDPEISVLIKMYNLNSFEDDEVFY